MGKLRNGECLDRRRLVYSNHTNDVSYFCCILFSDLKTKRTSEGNRDMKNILLADRKSSMKHIHIRAIGAYIELENRLKEGKTRKHTNLCKKRLSTGTMFYKESYVLCSFLQNGIYPFVVLWIDCLNQTMDIFLGMVELLGKYDSCLEDHLRYI